MPHTSRSSSRAHHLLPFLATLSLIAAGCDDDDTTTHDGEWIFGEADMQPGSSDLDASPDLEKDDGLLNPDMPQVPPLCGNGVIDDGETCDGNCPSPGECNVTDMGDRCVQLTYNGSPTTCSAECILVQETRCTSGDGCCPAGCSFDQDDDCEPGPVCGNGRIEDGELCDGDCPVSADECPELPSPDACTVPALVGAACQVMCSTRTITEFDDFDGCCPVGGTPSRDSDCIEEQICGDGIVQAGESCDGDCPQDDAACDDFNTCTIDSVMGDATMCAAMCTHAPVTACMSGDGCCPGGCEAQGDTDCNEVDLCMQPVPSPSSYGPASVISTFELGGDTVGIDFTGDGAADNAFGGLVDNIGVALGVTRQDYNQLLQQQIASGQLAILFEYDGLSGLQGPASFTTNILSGAPRCFDKPLGAGPHFYDVEPSSYDATGQPNAWLSPSTLSSGLVMAGNSSSDASVFIVEFDFGGVPLVLPVRQLRYSANVDTFRSALPSIGVMLEDGLLGGIIKLEDFYGALNDFVATSCGCVTFSSGSMELLQGGANATCNTSVSASQCGSAGIDSVCDSLVTNCSLLTSIFPSIADVDSGALDTNCFDTETCDSFSIGFNFKAVGARIVGLAPN